MARWDHALKWGLVVGLVPLSCKALSHREEPVATGAVVRSVTGPGATGGPIAPAAGTGAWSLEPREEGALRVAYDRAPILELGYVFWGKGWTWGDPRPEGGADHFAVKVDPLGLRLDGHIVREGDRLVATWDMHASRRLDGIIGGGLEITLPVDPVALGLGPVRLSDDGRGFTIAEGEGELSVRFDAPPPAIRIEGEEGRTVRVYLVAGSLEKGTTRHRMTITAPEGAGVQAPLAQRYGPEDRTGWPATLPWNAIGVDLRFLNEGDRPAGKRGPIRVEGNRLVHADGSEARFWGTNVVGYALFSDDKEAIAQQARRIAAYGFNLVRIHHHDSGWVEPNVFDTSGGSTRALRDASLDRLDWWIKCLQDEGIYVWLDLHVGRVFAPGDGLARQAELDERGGEAKGFNYLDPEIERAMQGFAHDYLGRTNRYTSRRYAEDPGVLAVLVTNENDLTYHFGNLFTADSGHEPYHRLFEKEVAAFAVKTGLPTDRLRETWQPGYGKLLLADLEARFHRRAIADLRKLGWGGPVATTNYWTGGIYCLPSLALGDLVDVHVYGKSELLETNPRFMPHFLSYAAAGQVAGMPLTVTEWNIPAPATDRFVGPLMVAATSSLQGWDAPMLYAYTQWKMGPPQNPDPFSAFDDPAAMVTMPNAALAYRRGDISLAETTYQFDLDRETVFGRDINAASSAALRTLAEQSRIVIGLPDTPELDWDAPHREPGAVEVRDLDEDHIPAGAHTVISDTGEISRDWKHGTHTIDTPRTQSAAGWTGGRTVTLRDLELRLSTPKSAVALSSLDGAPIAGSKELLLSVVARAVLGPGGAHPWRAEPVHGKVRFRSSHAAMSVTPLSATGAAAGPVIRTKAVRGWHELQLPEATTHWFRIEPASPRTGK